MNSKKVYREIIDLKQPKAIEYIKVGALYQVVKDRLNLQIVNAPHSFDHKIEQKELNRPGLALSGFVEVFTYWRVQIMGNTEIGYLNTLHGADRVKAISNVLDFDLPCIIVTNNNPIPPELIELADQHEITIFATPDNTTYVHRHLSEYLERAFAPYTVVHGTLVDVFSVGVLFVGPAAIGKSELALDLIERGHQLVADDAVQVKKIGVNALQGEPRGSIGHHMEIRGLGIIDVYKMFGVRGIRGKKDIHVIVKLEKFTDRSGYERTGLDELYTQIMGVDLPVVELPVMEGKNLTIVAEAIALDQKLKQIGIKQAHEFNRRLMLKNVSKQKHEDQVPEILIDAEDI
ncbi:HPr(Ser) kinase/phosphatase [candidate division KSB1 bacterium]|nr:HPr(Ser) kinase/phosphatase [candidate division KSB1 bacterium]RQW02695.1 MAG: HPr(Ser) kinase/phosphatase [candidate division KSB1 bacterium]